VLLWVTYQKIQNVASKSFVVFMKLKLHFSWSTSRSSCTSSIQRKYIFKTRKKSYKADL